MPLSEHEQRLLEQIEQSLYAEDPKFARTWRSRDLGSMKRARLLRAGAIFLVGLGALLAGVITLPGHPALGIGLGVGGFVVMLTAAWVGLATRGMSRLRAVADTPVKPHKQRVSLLARLEQRWERRQDGGGYPR